MYGLSVDGADSVLSHFAEYLPTVPKTTTSSVIYISSAYIWESIDYRNLYYLHEETNRRNTNRWTPREMSGSKTPNDRWYSL